MLGLHGAAIAILFPRARAAPRVWQRPAVAVAGAVISNVVDQHLALSTHEVVVKVWPRCLVARPVHEGRPLRYARTCARASLAIRLVHAIVGVVVLAAEIIPVNR